MAATVNDTTLSRPELTMLVNDLALAASIPHLAAVIAYRPSLDTEETVRTITGITEPKRTADRNWTITARDDAHPERVASTFRVDRLNVCCYCDARTGEVVTF